LIIEAPLDGEMPPGKQPNGGDCQQPGHAISSERHPQSTCERRRSRFDLVNSSNHLAQRATAIV
jgi:hypothetical protein